MAAFRILLKRIYEEPSMSDGYRVLVDRLWPRGVKKEDARLDEWCKDLSPSDELRKWFSHDVEKWKAFTQKYNAELQHNKEAARELLKRVTSNTLTLLYAAKDEAHNQAVVLKKFLEQLQHS